MASKHEMLKNIFHKYVIGMVKLRIHFVLI